MLLVLFGYVFPTSEDWNALVVGCTDCWIRCGGYKMYVYVGMDSYVFVFLIGDSLDLMIMSDIFLPRL